MLFNVVASTLALAASVAAISVTSPTAQTVWTTNGPNEVKWTKVDTDPSNFTIVLKTQDLKYQQVLAALVDTSLGSLSINAPSKGFPVGKALQVDLVRDDQNLAAILAQSPQFEIKQSESSSSSASASSTGSAASTASVTASTTGSGSSSKPSQSSASGSQAASGSASDLNPSASGAPNGALPVVAQSGVVAAVAAVFGAVAYVF